MSDIHRHSPELFDFTPSREEPLEAAGPDCYCGRDCEFPCWQRYGIAPVCKSCSWEELCAMAALIVAHPAFVPPCDEARDQIYGASIVEAE